VLARKRATVRSEFPGLSMAVAPVNRACTQTSQTPGLNPRLSSTSDLKLETSNALVRVGAWTDLDPPTSIPQWIGCEGFSGLLAYARSDETHMFVRAVAFPDSSTPGYAVIADLPVDDAMKERLRRNTGVEVRT